jgi:hypothetical protein
MVDFHLEGPGTKPGPFQALPLISFLPLFESLISFLPLCSFYFLLYSGPL